MEKEQKNGERIIYWDGGDKTEGIWGNDKINNKKIGYRYNKDDIYILNLT